MLARWILSIPARIAILLIDAYKIVFSHRTPCCRFLPTCSDYARAAVEKHGFAAGGVLTIWRLIRCNPLGGHGYDPVPDKKNKDIIVHG